MKRICVLGAGEKPISNIKGIVINPNDTITKVDQRKVDHTYVVMDLDKKEWPLKTDDFDIVVAEHIAEHMTDRISFLKNCHRICKPDGLVVIEVPNWSHICAHSTLEHVSTWGRCMFDDNYITRDYFLLENMDYRITIPFTWKSFYVPNRIGRFLDKSTRLISGLRFYLRVIK